MTDEDEKRERLAAEERKKELKSVSDKYLMELLSITERRLHEIREELNARGITGPQCNKLISLPCTLQELETAVHAYGDHNGFHGKVSIVLDSLIDPEANDYLGIAEVPA